METLKGTEQYGHKKFDLNTVAVARDAVNALFQQRVINALPLKTDVENGKLADSLEGSLSKLGAIHKTVRKDVLVTLEFEWGMTQSAAASAWNAAMHGACKDGLIERIARGKLVRLVDNTIETETQEKKESVEVDNTKKKVAQAKKESVKTSNTKKKVTQAKKDKK